MDNTPNSLSVHGFIIWILAVSFFMYEFALRTILGTFTHQIIPGLHLTPWTYSIIDSSYSISFLLFSVPMGFLTDRLGIRICMTLAMALLALATLFYSFATNFELGLIARLLMGAGSSLSFVSVVVILMMWFPRRYFAFLVGLSQLIATLGPMLGGGPLILYMHHAHLTWRLGLREIAIVGFIMAVLMLLIVRERKRERGFDQHYTKGVGDVLKYFKTLISKKQVWLVLLYTGCSYAGFQLLCTVWGVEYLQVRGFSQQLAADCITLGWVGYALACPLFGVLSDKLGQRSRLMSLMVLIGLLASITLFYLPRFSVSIYFIVFFLLGVAASGQNLSFVLLAEKVPAQIKASATALNNSTISVFVALSTLFTSFFVNRATSGNIAHASAANFNTGFIILPLMMLLALIASQLIREKRTWFTGV